MIKQTTIVVFGSLRIKRFSRFSAIVYANSKLFCKGICYKRKEFTPTYSNFFSFIVDPFSKGSGAIVILLPPLKNNGTLQKTANGNSNQEADVVVRCSYLVTFLTLFSGTFSVVNCQDCSATLLNRDLH